jgi:hypothetical protein
VLIAIAISVREGAAQMLDSANFGQESAGSILDNAESAAE